jgi:hypothetical protein
MSWASTFCDQPFSTAAVAYQSRVSGSLGFSSKAIWSYHGNVASGACSIGKSNHASANDFLSRRFRGENPLSSGKAERTSAESRVTTLLEPLRRLSPGKFVADCPIGKPHLPVGGRNCPGTTGIDRNRPVWIRTPATPGTNPAGLRGRGRHGWRRALHFLRSRQACLPFPL